MNVSEFMDALQKLQQWFQSQCNGEWEHRYGVTIGTLDNPGWYVHVDLTNTGLADRSFTDVVRNLEHDMDWIHCRVRDRKFEGNGGPFKLDEILQVFLAWAEETKVA